MIACAAAASTVGAGLYAGSFLDLLTAGHRTATPGPGPGPSVPQNATIVSTATPPAIVAVRTSGPLLQTADRGDFNSQRPAPVPEPPTGTVMRTAPSPSPSPSPWLSRPIPQHLPWYAASKDNVEPRALSVAESRRRNRRQSVNGTVPVNVAPPMRPMSSELRQPVSGRDENRRRRQRMFARERRYHRFGHQHTLTPWPMRVGSALPAVVAPPHNEVLGFGDKPRYLDYSAFDPSHDNRPTLSFYREGRDQVPADCPYVAKALADLGGRVESPSGRPCWRESCSKYSRMPTPCFSGCRCPIGPCRVVSVFRYDAERGTDHETLRCVDNAAFYVPRTAPYDDNLGRLPKALALDNAPLQRGVLTRDHTTASSFAQLAKLTNVSGDGSLVPRCEVVDSVERKPVLKPLVCPTSPPADPPPSMPSWPRLPADAMAGNDTALAQHDRWLRRLLAMEHKAMQGGAPSVVADVRVAVRRRAEELRAGGTIPPPYVEGMGQEEKLALFQRATAWRSAFPKWRRWAGKCAPASAIRHGGRLRGYHSHKDGFYRLENVCVGTGPDVPALSGFDPAAENFEGTDEHAIPAEAWGPVRFHTLLQQNINPILRSIHSIDPASKSPSDECFLDTDTVLMLPKFGGTNAGHGIRIATATALGIKEWFNGSTDDPLILYGEHPGEPQAAAALFAPLLSKYAGHFYASPPSLPRSGTTNTTNASTPAREKLNFRAPAPPVNSRACFRSVVLPHVCRANGQMKLACHQLDPSLPWQPPGRHDLPERFRRNATVSVPPLTSSGINGSHSGGKSNISHIGTKAQRHVAYSATTLKLRRVPEIAWRRRQSGRFVPLGNQHRVLLHGRRGPSDAAAFTLLRRRVAACLGVELRDKPRTERPHVVFAARSISRQDVMATRAGDIAQAAADRGAGRFTVLESGYADPAEYLRYYLDADVLYGPYGSGLTWLLLLPPGGVAVIGGMISQNVTAWTPAVAVDRASPAFVSPHSKTWQDYAGDGVLSQVSTLMLPGLTPLASPRHVLQHDGPSLLESLDAAWCALRVGYRHTPARCPAPLQTETFINRYVHDVVRRL